MTPRQGPAPDAQNAEGGQENQAGSRSRSSLTPPEGNALSFAQCLDLLELNNDELLSFGTEHKAGDFRGRQYTVGRLKAMDLSAYADHNVWCGLQPMAKGGIRGKSEDVVRLAALYADLDLADDKLPTVDAIEKVIAALSDMIGSTPTYIVFSGHGYQPVWKVDSDDSADLERMLPLLGGWGRLVKQVAAAHGGSADSVFDAARILRVPGTVNWKNVDEPVKTWAKAADA